MGSPLSQSLFTSLYLDRLLWPEPKTLEQARFDRDTVPQGNQLLHRVLRAFCLGVIKSCDFVYRKIIAEHYYEVGRANHIDTCVYCWSSIANFK